MDGWTGGGGEGGRVDKLITAWNWINDRGFFDWLTTSYTYYELMRDWWKTNWKCSWWLINSYKPAALFKFLSVSC